MHERLVNEGIEGLANFPVALQSEGRTQRGFELLGNSPKGASQITVLTGKFDVVEDGGRMSLEVAAEQVPAVLSVAGEHRVQDVTCEPASLEDLFLRHYEEAR